MTSSHLIGFKVLNEPERASVFYTLLQHLTQDQLRFFVAVLQQMIHPQKSKPSPGPYSSVLTNSPRFQLTPTVGEPQVRPKLGKPSFRPPIPNLESPLTPTPVTAKESATDVLESHHNLLVQAVMNREARSQATPSVEGNWSNLVNTPMIPMFHQDKNSKDTKPVSLTASLPGFRGINPYTLNMLANAGLSAEAQVLAAQLVMSGLVRPTGRTSGFSVKPKKEGFDAEMLKDIPGWLRSLRLHKYTSAFDGLTWEQMVVLDDATLKARGVATLGARRRLLKTFDHVRTSMGMEEPSSATPTTSAIPIGAASRTASEAEQLPHSTLPGSKLSINSPIFTPTWEANKVPHSAPPSTRSWQADISYVSN
jgi:hypothetical protein